MLFASSKNITLDQSKADAHVKGQWIMPDFYAYWCVSCQELKHMTFADNEVQADLSNLALVQTDVTQDNAPARKIYRIVGYVNSK